MEKSQYKSLNEWNKAEPNAYASANKQGLVERICNIFGWEYTKPTKWNEINCLNEAQNFKTITEWQKKSNGSLKYARNKGEAFWNKCIEHMDSVQKPKGYWTKKRCLEVAQKCKTKVEWIKKFGTSYAIASKNGWVEECSIYMEQLQKPHGYWNNKERCLKEAKKHKTRGAWSKASSISVKWAMQNGWLDECTAHMIIKERKSKGFWTKNNVISEAKKHKYQQDWIKTEPTSYDIARKNNWLEECTNHMQKPEIKIKWTFENCLLDAKKYKTITEWATCSGGAHNAAKKNGWFNKCIEHMVSNKKPNGYWDIKSNCYEVAVQCKTTNEFRKTHQLAYQSSVKNKWITEFYTLITKNSK